MERDFWWCNISFLVRRVVIVTIRKDGKSWSCHKGNVWSGCSGRSQQVSGGVIGLRGWYLRPILEEVCLEKLVPKKFRETAQRVDFKEAVSHFGE